MAYSAAQKKKARHGYVFERLALATIAVTLGVPLSTVRRWKREASARSDDWDVARSAHLIGGQGLESVIGSTVEDFALMAQATMEKMKSTKYEPDEIVKMMASLADSTNKMIAASGRLTPKISQLGVAQDVLQRLTNFVQEDFPHHADAFLEILEPFGYELAKAYE